MPSTQRGSDVEARQGAAVGRPAHNTRRGAAAACPEPREVLPLPTGHDVSRHVRQRLSGFCVMLDGVDEVLTDEE